MVDPEEVREPEAGDKVQQQLTNLESMMLSTKFGLDFVQQQLMSGDQGKILQAIQVVSGLRSAYTQMAYQYVALNHRIKQCGKCSHKNLLLRQHLISEDANPIYSMVCAKCQWESDKFSPHSKGELIKIVKDEDDEPESSTEDGV